jgi:hypothetical protein
MNHTQREFVKTNQTNKEVQIDNLNRNRIEQSKHSTARPRIFQVLKGNKHARTMRKNIRSKLPISCLLVNVLFAQCVLLMLDERKQIDRGLIVEGKRKEKTSNF